jgi:endonuclease III
VSDQISAVDLGIHVERGEGELFKWFLASFLFGKRIQRDIAANAYRVIVEKYQLDTPTKLARCSHRAMVRMLGEARYVRYDESTAARLLKLCNKLIDDYDGRLSQMHRVSKDDQAFRKRLAEFEGFGPKTVEIFMREASRAFPTA